MRKFLCKSLIFEKKAVAFFVVKAHISIFDKRRRMNNKLFGHPFHEHEQ